MQGVQEMVNPDGLRPIEYFSEADPRNLCFSLVDANGTARPMTLRDRFAEISNCVLHDGVPKGVTDQFETVKNVYLYSWFVYRFFTVAEHQSYICLELALRERLQTEIASGKIGSRRPTLRPLLKYAVDHKLLSNEGFETWRNRGEINSRERVRAEALRKMVECNLETIAIDYSAVQITDEDLDWDYTSQLVDTLPDLRNGYAHGSEDVHNWSLRMIKIVCEVINQLFEPPTKTEHD
jgi:hypothetical protein